MSDNKVYTEDSINNLPDLIYSLMIMARAHEESALKGSRVADAWANKRKRAITEGHKITHKCPGWLELNNNHFTIIPDRAQLVQRMFQTCLNGYGAIAITKQLNEEQIPTWRKSDGWHISYIQTILHSPAVYGQFTPGLINKTKLDPIDNYFPEIIPKETFFATQHAIAQRNRKGGRPGARVNVFAALLRCGKCKGSVVRINKGRHTIPVFACANGLRAMSDCKYHPWAVQEVEQILLSHLQDLDVASLFSQQESKLAAIRSQIAATTISITKTKRQLTNVAEAIKQGGNIPTLVATMRELEGEVSAGEAALDVLVKDERAELQKRSNATVASEYVQALITSDDRSLRVKLQSHIRNLIESVVIHLPIRKIAVRYNVKDYQQKLVVIFANGSMMQFNEDVLPECTALPRR